MSQGRTVLALNAGSSSLKFALYAERGYTIVRIDAASVEGQDGDVAAALAWAQARVGRLDAVGHRVVHGGGFTRAAPVTGEVLEALRALIPLAPLHQPKSLDCIGQVALAHPELPQVACFDTAFHQGRDPVVSRLPIPRAWEAKGLKRYGFHGLSYEHLSRRLAVLDPKLAAGRVILAHLGSGASLCAVSGGRSVDTTMGFSTLDGLVMATRPGALDAGVVLHLIQREGLTPGEVQDMLYRQSGLLGLSGQSGDMRTLLASDRLEAQEAVEAYVLQIVRQAGALAAMLGGIDGLVFSGGVGEHAPEIRRRVCERLAWLGLALDPLANSVNARTLEASGSRVAVRVIPTEEERVIAEQTLAALAG